MCKHLDAGNGSQAQRCFNQISTFLSEMLDKEQAGGFYMPSVYLSIAEAIQGGSGKTFLKQTVKQSDTNKDKEQRRPYSVPFSRALGHLRRAIS